MKRRACDQCHGTDTQRECEQGQCYAEHCRDEQEREDRYWQERYAAEQASLSTDVGEGL